MYNPYNSQMYVQDLQNMRDRIDRQLQMVNQNQPQTTPITQNFQLATNNTGKGIKYVDNIEEVKNEFVFVDTLFINKGYTQLWLKNASGEVKTYQLTEIVKKDEKDIKIAELEEKINMLVKEKENEQYANQNVDGTTTVKKSTNGKPNTTSNE